MFQALDSTGDVQAAFLFAVFVLNSFVLAKIVFHALLGKRARYVWLERALAVASSLVLFWLAFDWICFTQIRGLTPAFFSDPLWGVGSICLAAVGSWMYLRFAAVEFRVRDLVGTRLVGLLTLMLSVAAATGWSGYRFHETIKPVPFTLDYELPPGTVATLQEFVGVTDTGRIIPLSKWEVDPQAFDAFDFNALYATARGISAVIPRASPDSSSNCHGWVFTGGLFHLGGAQVDQILTDNGYYVVNKPKADDLVIYRDMQGKAVHTGLVRGVLEDGTVIVESKWSVSSRFLHRPEDQPYSEEFQYYRSSRLWHLVTIVPVEDIPANEVLSSDFGDVWNADSQTAHGNEASTASDLDRITL